MNRVTIQRTVFQNYNTEDKTYGFRMYDDHGQSYCNIMDKADLDLSDEGFLKEAMPFFDEVCDSMFDYALEHGIYVDDNWYKLEMSDRSGAILKKLKA